MSFGWSLAVYAEVRKTEAHKDTRTQSTKYKGQMLERTWFLDIEKQM